MEKHLVYAEAEEVWNVQRFILKSLLADERKQKSYTILKGQFFNGL